MTGGRSSLDELVLDWYEDGAGRGEEVTTKTPQRRARRAGGTARINVMIVVLTKDLTYFIAKE